MATAFETWLDVTNLPIGDSLISDGSTDCSAPLRAMIDNIQRDKYDNIAGHQVHFPPNSTSSGGGENDYVFYTPVRWGAYNATLNNSIRAMGGIKITGGGMMLDGALHDEGTETARLRAGVTTGKTESATSTSVDLPEGVETFNQAYQFCKIKMMSGPAIGQEREIISYEADHTGICGDVKADSIVLDSVVIQADGYYNGMVIEITSGDAVGVRRYIENYTRDGNICDNLNYIKWAITPSLGDSYIMHSNTVVSDNRRVTVGVEFDPTPTPGGGDTFEIICSPIWIIDGLGGAILEGLNFYGRARMSSGVKAAYLIGHASDVNSGQKTIRSCAFGEADIGWDNDPGKYSYRDPGNKNTDLCLFLNSHWEDMGIVAFRNRQSQAMSHVFFRINFNSCRLCLDIVDSGSFRVDSASIIKCGAFVRVTNSGSSVGGFLCTHMKIDGQSPRCAPIYEEINNKPHNMVTFQSLTIPGGQGVTGGDVLFKMNGGKLTVRDSVFQQMGISDQRLVKLIVPNKYDSTAKFENCIGFKTPLGDMSLGLEYIDFDREDINTTSNWYKFIDCYEFRTKGVPFSEGNWGVGRELTQQVKCQLGLNIDVSIKNISIQKNSPILL